MQESRENYFYNSATKEKYKVKKNAKFYQIYSILTCEDRKCKISTSRWILNLLDLTFHQSDIRLKLSHKS